MNGRTAERPVSWNGASASPDESKDDESVFVSMDRVPDARRPADAAFGWPPRNTPPASSACHPPEIPIQPVMGFEEEKE